MRWSADGMWTNAGAAELIEPAKALFGDVPTPESHVFWYPWRPQEFGDAAISVQGELYLAAFAGWHDPAEDERYIAWPTRTCGGWSRSREGIQLADENLWRAPGAIPVRRERGPARTLRAQYDPEGRFHSYLTTAGGTE